MDRFVDLLGDNSKGMTVVFDPPWLLVSQPFRERYENLRPLVECLSRRAPARLFHVILVPKGERMAPEELQASMSLLDESSVFLVPLEEDREPASLLRTMLARVLP